MTLARRLGSFLFLAFSARYNKSFNHLVTNDLIQNGQVYGRIFPDVNQYAAALDLRATAQCHRPPATVINTNGLCYRVKALLGPVADVVPIHTAFAWRVVSDFNG